MKLFTFLADVGFESWSLWSSCSASCNGTRIRSRECFGYCIGERTQKESCGTSQCPSKTPTKRTVIIDETFRDN